jgi:FKBP-type peptidyl-prolyl cis-trans isomerase FkpA
MIKLALLVLVVGAAAGCNGEVLGAGTPSDPTTETFAPSLNVDIPSFERTESGVFYKDSIVGTGEVATAEDQVTIIYAGYLRDGTLFDSRNIAFQQPLAVFIRGFRDGVTGMRAGSVQQPAWRKIVIPSELAYGWRGRPEADPPIPRNATLVFNVGLLAVTKPPTPTQ